MKGEEVTYEERFYFCANADENEFETGSMTNTNLPVGHYSLMNLENLNIQEEESHTYDSMLHIYPTGGIDYSVLNEDEKKIIDKVIEKFKDYKAKDIVEYMHEEKAYIETKPGDIIPFSLAKEIREL